MQLFENLILMGSDSEGAKKNKIEMKIAFKVVQLKFLAMHITDQKLSFDIFTENIFMEHELYLISYWFLA